MSTRSVPVVVFKNDTGITVTMPELRELKDWNEWKTRLNLHLRTFGIKKYLTQEASVETDDDAATVQRLMVTPLSPQVLAKITAAGWTEDTGPKATYEIIEKAVLNINTMSFHSMYMKLIRMSLKNYTAFAAMLQDADATYRALNTAEAYSKRYYVAHLLRAIEKEMPDSFMLWTNNLATGSTADDCLRFLQTLANDKSPSVSNRAVMGP